MPAIVHLCSEQAAREKYQRAKATDAGGDTTSAEAEAKKKANQEAAGENKKTKKKEVRCATHGLALRHNAPRSLPFSL